MGSGRGNGAGAAVRAGGRKLWTAAPGGGGPVGGGTGRPAGRGEGGREGGGIDLVLGVVVVVVAPVRLAVDVVVLADDRGPQLGRALHDALGDLVAVLVLAGDVLVNQVTVLIADPDGDSLQVELRVGEIVAPLQGPDRGGGAARVAELTDLVEGVVLAPPLTDAREQFAQGLDPQ